MSATGNATTSSRPTGDSASFLLWMLKPTLLWIAILAATLAAGMLVPIHAPPPLADGPLTVVEALLAVNALNAIALALVAAQARLHGWRLSALLFVAYFGIGSAMMQIETLWFNDSLKLPLSVVGELVANSAITAAAAAVAGALLFRPASVEIEPVPATLLRRVVLMALIYVVLYYGAGTFIAWQSEAVRAYYENGVHIPFLPTITFQVFRGTLWALIALFIVTRMTGSLRRRALVMGCLFAVLTAAQLLYPTYFFPWAVRSVHLLEVGTSEFVYGIVATAVLLAGAAKRPLSATSPWRLIAGRA